MSLSASAKVKSVLQSVLALGLVTLCSGAMADEAVAMAETGLNAELAWLLGSLVLGFSVIARRDKSFVANTTPEPQRKPETAATAVRHPHMAQA